MAEQLFDMLQRGAREHNQEHGTRNMQIMQTNLACPLCTHTEVPLLQNPANRNIYCTGPTKHEWRDMEALQAYPIRKLKNAPPPPSTPQPNHTTIQVSVPNIVLEQLTARFGAKLSACAGAVLVAMVQPKSYVVSEDDAVRISKVLGTEIKDGQQLYGAVFSLHKDKVTLAGQLQEIQRGTPVSAAMGGAIPLDLDATTVQVLSEKAKFNGKSLARYLSDYIIDATRNAWI